MDSLIIFVAKYFFLLSILIVAAYWLRVGTSTKIELALRAIVGGVIALLLSRVASALYYDPRPFVVAHIKPLIPHAADNGFPSDHALLTSFLGFVVLSYSKKVGSLLLLVAVLVGAARVAAHIHHSLDIVGSFVLAAVAAALVTFLITTERLNTLRARRSQKP